MQETLKKAIELKIILDEFRPLDKETESRIMQKFRLDWNYHSNHIEGNRLTYGETKALLLHGITAQGKPLKDHFEITGHNKAINGVIDILKDERPLTENFIKEFHAILLKESYESDAITPDGKPTKKRIEVGSYKKSPNHVKTKTGEIFYFATPEETPSKMYDLINWYRKVEKEINPIILAAEFHYRFIRIHPFDDGNGRVARILMNFILMKHNYPPVIIKTEDKENYFSALQQADAGIIDAFIKYITENLNHSLELMIAGAKGESIEEADDVLKELKLIEQEIDQLSKNRKVKKSKESVEQLIQIGIGERLFENLENNLIPVSEKFKQKLVGVKTLIKNGDTLLTSYQYSNENFNNAQSALLRNLTDIFIEEFDFYLISFKFSELLKLPEIDTPIEKTIQIEFNEYSYNINLIFDQKTTVITHKYGVWPSETEVKKFQALLIKSITKSLRKLIDAYNKR